MVHRFPAYSTPPDSLVGFGEGVGKEGMERDGEGKEKKRRK